MRKKINVLHIVEDLGVGGIERVVATIANGLDTHRYNTVIWCLARGGVIADELRDKGMKIEILGMGYHCTPFFFLRLYKKMCKMSPHIIHTHGYTATTVGRMGGIIARVPIIVSHIHTNFSKYTQRQILIERLLNFFTDRIICCSQAVLDSVDLQFKIKNGKGVVIYNGVDELEFSKEVDAIKIKEELNLSPEGPLLGCIASLTSHKGHRYLLEAMKIITKSQELAKGRLPKLILVGDGPLRKNLQDYAVSAGISSDVIFMGIQQDIAKILSIVDIIVLASCKWEGLGLSLIEAMSRGKAVIGTNIGGIPEVIKPGQTGIIVLSEDAQSLAEAILSLLKDEEKLKRMGVAGYRFYRERFTATHMLREVEKLYSLLVEEKGIGRLSLSYDTVSPRTKLARTEKISAALILKNEEKYIRQCLESLKWLDEIVILDGYSTDRTLEIAREFTSKIYQKEFSGFPEERQYLLSKTSYNWVFMVDGDMFVSKELREEIEKRFSEPVNEYAAFNLRFLNIYLGREIRHCGWYDPNNTRIFNKQKGSYDTHLKYLDIFTPREGKIGVLENHILHFGFETISEHLMRIDRYSTLNAQDLMIKGYRITVFNIPWFFTIKPISILLYKFIYKGGFLDGSVGLILSLMSAITYGISYFKLWEIQKKKRLDLTNILYISSFGYLRGGGQISLWNLLCRLDRSKYNPVLICPEKGDLLMSSQNIGISTEIITFPLLRPWNLFSMLETLFRLFKIMKKYEVNIVHTDDLRQVLYCGVLKLLHRFHLIWHIRVSWKNIFFDRIGFCLSNKIICTAKIIADRFLHLPSYAQKVEIIYNAVDPDYFSPAKASLEEKGRFDIGAQDFVIGVVSRLHPIKGIHFLIESFPEVYKYSRNAKLIIVGDGPREYVQQLKRRVKELGLGTAVVFTGFKKDVRPFLNMCDLFILPTLEEEGASRSILEAMACGLPILTTDSGGNSELVEDGVSGKIIGKPAPDIIARQTIQLLSQRECLLEMGETARRRVIENFSIFKNVRLTEDIYLDLSSQHLKVLDKLKDDFSQYLFREGLSILAEGIKHRQDPFHFFNFIWNKKLREDEVKYYLEKENNFNIEMTTRFIKKYRPRLPALIYHNLNIFQKLLWQKPVSSKDYSERILAQSLQFQIDNYYQPKTEWAKNRINVVLNILSPQLGESILDVGCGVGTFTYHTAKYGAKAIGIDFSEQSIRVAEQLRRQFYTKEKSKFIVSDGIKLPFRNSCFDKIVISDFIEHISCKNKMVLLEEAQRILINNGCAVISMPNIFREKIGKIKRKVSLLTGKTELETRLHIGLISRFKFERMLRQKGLKFKCYYFDESRPLLAKIPLLKQFLSIHILWKIWR